MTKIKKNAPNIPDKISHQQKCPPLKYLSNISLIIAIKKENKTIPKFEGSTWNIDFKIAQ